MRLFRFAALAFAAWTASQWVANPAASQTPSGQKYGCISIHEVHATITAQEARRTGVPPGFKIFPQLPDANDPLLLRESPIVQGGEIAEAKATLNEQTRKSVVTIRLNPAGADKLGAFTKNNIGRLMAIVLDDHVILSSVIKDPILGGSLNIHSNFSTADGLQQLVNLLSLRTCV